jgi:hypothetical protein
MQTIFSDVVEQVKTLSFEEKAELKFLLESYLIEERREEIYQNYEMTKKHEDDFEFSADLNKLKKMLDA